VYEIILKCHDGVYLYVDLPLSLETIKSKLKEHPSFPYTTKEGITYTTSDIISFRDTDTREEIPLL
jgi:hypothetical protein